MKKAVPIIVVICLLVVMSATLFACQTPQDTNKDYSAYRVLYLGDSIAEAIAGPSPVEERANYGYYGIIGQINGYQYENRAISGNQTGELLAYVSRETEDAYVHQALISQADVICISITGNDLLWNNFPLMMFEIAAKEKYGDAYVDQTVVKEGYEYHRYQVIDKTTGKMRSVTPDEDITADGNVRPIEPGDGLATFERCLAVARANVEAVVAKLKEKNEDVTILFQNVYNPVDDESEMIPVDLVADMMKLDAKYDFGTPAGVAEYRRLGAYMLGALSNILEEVAASNERVEFVDVAAAFDRIYQADQAKGKDLIFVDGVHPSDQGHAVIASTLQDKLAALGFAEKTKSLANYKSLRIGQLERLYKGVAGFDYEAACAAVNQASDMLAVGDAYFAAVEGYTPILSQDPAEGKPTNGVAVDEDETYELYRVVSRKADKKGQKQIDGILELVDLVVYQKHLVLHKDGTMDLTVKLPLGDLLPLLSAAEINFDGTVLGGIEDTFYKDEAGNLTNLKMSGAMDTFRTIKVYADAIVPGVAFSSGNFGRNFHYLYDSVGLGLEGLEPLTATPYTDEVGLPLDGAEDGTVDASTIGVTYNSYVDYLIAYLGRYQRVVDADGKVLTVDKLPDGITAKVQELGDVTVKIKTCYSLKTVQGADGTEYKAVYCGPYSDKTAPWMVMTKYTVDDEEYIKMNFEVLGMDIQFKKEVE